ncbi:MAG: MJ0042-type zinc finger domain-containing protein [Candidatus Deferrimicrobiaceae bacterium]
MSSSIVLTCGDCGTSFRLDVALLQGAKGGRIRCRRCGGSIVAQSPEAPTVLTAADVVPIYAEAPSLEPGPAPSPQPEAAGPRMDTGSQEMRDPGDAVPVSPEIPDPDRNPPEENIAEEVVPPVEEREVFSGAILHEPVPVPVPLPGSKAPSRRAPSRSTLLIVFVLCVLPLAAGVLYFGTTKSGHDILGKLFAGLGWMPSGSVAETPYDFRNVKWSIEKETASGTLFVVKGEVANIGKGPSGGIGIRATLMGKDNQSLVETSAFAGNILDNASLGRMDRPGIAGAMSNRFGEGNVNKEIPPGKALPFMVIFFDPPGGIEAVMVRADDAR